MMMAVKVGRPVDARRGKRRQTCWDALCRVDQRILTGAVLDISAHGAFFSPGQDDAVPRSPAIGEPAAIAFETDPNLAGLDLPCRVAWVGYSRAHGCHGFGLEFTSGPALA
jgi:PilZ domain